MKIVSLTAENVKRIRAVHIEPNGTLVTIAGRNAQGKTSVLDSIWMALGGPAASKNTTRPIRDGEDSAQVTVDLGEIRVARTWTADGKASKLTVTAADGARYNSPQAMLDQLVGRLSFDPLSFAQQDDKTQRRTLLDLVDLPFDPDVLAEQRATIFGHRTDANRDLKTAQAQLAGMTAPAPGLPDQEVSASDLLRQARDAQAQQQDRERALNTAADAAHQVERLKGELAAAELDARTADADVAALPRELPDLAAIEASLGSIEQTNIAIRAARDHAAATARVADLVADSADLSSRIAALDEQRDTALADAAMPIEGLGLDDTGVSYLGVPLKQSSSAEQLRVSLAMAMALNPRIRVIRITDGSLLDSTNMALIEQMAAASDFQVWVERVDESGQVGVLIEDGAVVEKLSALPQPVGIDDREEVSA